MALPQPSNPREGLMRHSMCNFFCMTSRHASVQANCLRRNRCKRVKGLTVIDDRQEAEEVLDEDADALITDAEERRR